MDISLSTMLKALGLALLVVAAFFLRELILAVLVSVVIAASVEPIVNRLARFKIGRVPAVLITYVIVFSLFAGILRLFLFPILSELQVRMNEAVPVVC